MFLLNHVEDRDYEGIYTTPLCTSEDRQKLNKLKNTITKEAKEYNLNIENLFKKLNKDRKLYLLKLEELQNNYPSLKKYNMFKLNTCYKENLVSLEIINIDNI